MPIDYSKWKDIEVSDDEDDTHPNIDTPSLFRWRHQARVQRMEEFQAKKADVQKSVKTLADKVKRLTAALDEKSADVEATKTLKADLSKAKADLAEAEAKEEEVAKEEKLAPWNVDTISKESWSKTVINKPPASSKHELSDEEKADRQREHTRLYEKEMQKFGMLRKWDDSRSCLADQQHLVCEETANYLVIWCINLQMEGKNELMCHVAHQAIVMQFILELAKQLERDPRSCVSSFFARIRHTDAQYQDAFNDELSAFKRRIERRAEEKLAEIRAEVDQEEREARLGPGGLDPVEVYEELPKELQECFDSKDIPMLQKVLTSIPEAEARVWLQKCIDSGLWVPGGGEGIGEGPEASTDGDPGAKAADGAIEKSADGSNEKSADDSKEKSADGSKEKPADGSKEKSADGSKEKSADGSKEKSADGSKEKSADGSKEKSADGSKEKSADGSKEKSADDAKQKSADD